MQARRWRLIISSQLLFSGMVQSKNDPDPARSTFGTPHPTATQQQQKPHCSPPGPALRAVLGKELQLRPHPVLSPRWAPQPAGRAGGSIWSRLHHSRVNEKHAKASDKASDHHLELPCTSNLPAGLQPCVDCMQSDPQCLLTTTAIRRAPGPGAISHGLTTASRHGGCLLRPARILDPPLPGQSSGNHNVLCRVPQSGAGELRQSSRNAAGIELCS